MIDTPDTNSAPLAEGKHHPLLVQCTSPSLSAEEWCRKYRDPILAALPAHGAVLLRGFSLRDLEEFRRMVDTLCDQLAPYEERATPRNELSDAFVLVFQHVLERDDLSGSQNFFELGGQSIEVLQAISRIQATLGLEIPHRLFFDHPTADSLAAAINEMPAATS